MADHSEMIEHLDQQLANGVTQTTVDGETEKVDLDSLRRERERLRRLDRAQRVVRPVSGTITGFGGAH